MSQNSILQFADKINELMPGIIQGFARRQVDELYKGKITLPQFLILDFLNRNGESRMTDMAHFMRVTTPAMTGIAERLVGAGYVIRLYSPEDRRIIKIKLTAKGGDLVRKINEQRRRMIVSIFGNISEGDRRDYLRILMEISRVLARDNASVTRASS